MPREYVKADELRRALDAGGWRPTGSEGPGRSRCPAHGGDGLNLSWVIGPEGGAIVTCHSRGCARKDVLRSLGLLGTEDHRPPDHPRNALGGVAVKGPPLTLAAWADHLCLPREFLAGEGLRDGTVAVGKGRRSVTGVIVPCRDLGGKTIGEWVRMPLGAKGAKYLVSADLPEIGAYGAHRLPGWWAESRPGSRWPCLWLVEGQTDALTLWYAGLPALGIPGDRSTGKVESEHIQGVRLILAVQEPDEGGKIFIEGVRERLTELGYEGEARAVRMPSPHKDPSDLWRANPDRERFLDSLRTAARSAEPLEIGEDGVLWYEDIEPEDLRWLWRPYLLAGRLSFLFGQPAEGKSYLSVALAVALSGASPPPAGEVVDPGPVIIFAAEDSVRQTVRERLAQCGAPGGRRIGVYDFAAGGQFSLNDMKKLASLLSRHRPAAVVLDPLANFLAGGKVDMRSQGQVRELIRPLGELAAEYNTSVLAIAHANKGGGSGSRAFHALMDSIDLSAYVRTLLGAYPDPYRIGVQNGRRYGVLAHVKWNLSSRGESIGYEIGDDGLHWRGTVPWSATVLDMVNRLSTSQQQRLGEVLEVLTGELAGGERRASEVFAALQDAGFSRHEELVGVARAVLGVTFPDGVRREIGDGGKTVWWWSLPDVDVVEAASVEVPPDDATGLPF